MPSFPANSAPRDLAPKMPLQASKPSVVASGHLSPDTGSSTSSMKTMVLESHGRESFDADAEDSDNTRKALAKIRVQVSDTY